jgi:hypothetical protein
MKVVVDYFVVKGSQNEIIIKELALAADAIM